MRNIHFRRRFSMLRLCSSLVLMTVLGCSSSGSSGEDTPERGPLGKQDGAGTCEDACGGRSEGGCWCDESCVANGDCCHDARDVCGITACPDPGAANVDVISSDPLQCAAIDFVCADGQSAYSNECGCGCIAPQGFPGCPAANDPAVNYVSRDPGQCAVIFFACEDDQVLFSDACGCGCIGQPEAPGCPDPEAPEVHYVSQDPQACLAILFQCPEGESLFTNECGCGCIGPEDSGCPDPNDPKVAYESQDPQQCPEAFVCPVGADEAQVNGTFNDECGCGCIEGPQPACPDPADPTVHYISMDFAQCLAIDWVCADGQEPFHDHCGCGCVET
jgi:hypothetical protein